STARSGPRVDPSPALFRRSSPPRRGRSRPPRPARAAAPGSPAVAVPPAVAVAAVAGAAGRAVVGGKSVVRATSRRVVVLVLVAVLVVAGAVVFAVASGDGTVPGREITRYDVTVDLERDGAAQVSIDLDFVFGAEPGHGPYIWLPTRQGFD